MPENASLIDQKGNGKNKSVEPVWRVNRQIKIQGRIVFSMLIYAIILYV